MILNSIEQDKAAPPGMPPVILLHGLFGTARNLGAVARGLSDAARVVSLDLRNHGESAHHATMDYPAMAADILETMDTKGMKSATVIGHSMGGKAAMTLALTQPGRVEKLVVMDIAPVPYTHDYNDYVKAMQAIPLNNDVNRKAANEMLEASIPDPALRVFLLSNLELGASPHWRFGLNEIGGAIPNLTGWDDPPGAQPYPGPALFLRGGNSDYVTAAARAPITRLFPAAKIQTIEGAAHWLHAEQPRAVIAALREFLF